MKNNTILAQIIEDYFNKIDDFYEAKNQFIEDVNLILRTQGDLEGVMSRTEFNEAFSTFAESVRSESV